MTVSGLSLRKQLRRFELVLVTRPLQEPEWPPLTRVRVTPLPDPEVFQPVVLVSKPGLVTRFGPGCDVVDVTVIATVPVSVPPRPSETV